MIELDALGGVGVNMIVAGLASLAVALGFILWRRVRRPRAGAETPAPAAPASRRDRLRLGLLPLTDLQPHPDHPYLAHGLTADLVALIARNPRIAVVELQPSDGAPLDPGTIAVDFLLEGTVRRLERRLLIEINLIEVATGEEIWSDTYDFPIARTAEMEDEITEAVCSALAAAGVIEPAGAEGAATAMAPITRALITNAEGLMPFVYRPSAAARAVRLLTHAMRLDPGAHRAKALLARTLSERAGLLASPSPEADRTEAQKLERLVLGARADKDGTVRAALEAGRIARGLSPDGKRTYRLAAPRRGNPAADPASPVQGLTEAELMLRRGAYAEAASRLKACTDAAPDFHLAWLLRALAHAGLGEDMRAREALARSLGIAPWLDDKTILSRLDAAKPSPRLRQAIEAMIVQSRMVAT